MEIEIPSPSVFLRKSPVLPAAKPAPAKKQPTKPRVPATTKPSTKATTATANGQANGITKPKQSKSRNGCMTCKKKRLKCDETKPSCVQCQKRSVVCEGYKKDYKWRTFEETTQNSKAAKAKKVAAQGGELTASSSLEDCPRPQSSESSRSPLDKPSNVSPGLHNAFAAANHAFTGPSPPSHGTTLASPPSNLSPSHFMFDPEMSPSKFDLPSPPPPPVAPPLPPQRRHSANNLPFNHVRDNFSPQPSFSSGSPQLIDLLLPGTDLNQPPDSSELRPPMSPLPYQPNLGQMDLDSGMDMGSDDDFDEEITRSMSNRPRSESMPSQWQLRPLSPALSEASTTSSKSTDLTILRAPQLDVSSPEMLMLRFDKETCGILSVKDGPNENPWRTLIWPLARDSHALYHAISSMTAFHGSLTDRSLRVAGVAHMTKSIKKLASEIENMRLDQALATSLALALSEGWDEKISTGIQHLRGAKVMVKNALVKRRQDVVKGRLNPEDAMRLKFLCNTFIYMDVIARLTSMEEQDVGPEDVLHTVSNLFGNNGEEVDPLMGCATTLFPIIGRIANLIQKVRRTETNSLHIVSEAMELKEQLLQWQPPNIVNVERPQDPTSEVGHSIQTAESYKYATLLYLHQAVPEIPSDPSHVLAKKVLTLLAGVPLSSRTIIVQIFPLLVGSCEMIAEEDRQWATERWLAMIRRLSIVNVSSCLKVAREVWQRRDEYEAVRMHRMSQKFASRSMPPGFFIPPTLKRKMNSADVLDDQNFFAAYGGPELMIDHDGRPLKRRLTFDTMINPVDMAGHMPMLMRRTTDVPEDGMDPEYTVRGSLHWLAVMVEWNWEVFLG